MATVTFSSHEFHFWPPIPQGGIGSGFGLGPTYEFHHAAIAVTAHALDSGVDLEVVQTTIENVPIGTYDTKYTLWFAVKNHSALPISGLLACVGVITE
jgi:hypothetical protein